RVGTDAAPIAVLLADDHTAVRRALRLLLDAEEDVQVIAEVSDLADIVEHTDAAQPQVVVLDLDRPGGASIHTIGRLRRKTPAAQLVLLTLEESPVFTQQALAAGAVGIVAKHHSDSELPTAVRAAVHGELYVSPSIAARLDALRATQAEDRLSQREVEVLRLIALGYTSVEIADKLHLSPRTVESHRAHITAKLGLSTRAELVSYALARGLLASESPAAS
ncbi:MAG TPA: response regulator transcription factor, partial [Solirubrobacteraceae bacterium]|nr:response regulator transcription factor [Solirubrobacteraceae bacterium]